MDRVRSNYWDGWKGLCIIAVVVLHAYPSDLGSSTGTWHWYTAYLSYEVFEFPVALFLAIAGFFSNPQSIANGGESATSYYRRRFKRILPAYLIWTAIYIGLQHRGDLRSFSRMTRDVFLGTGVGVGYFIVVLAQFVLLTPLLARINKRKIHIALMALLFACGLTFTYVIRFEFPASPLTQFPYYCILFVVWYPFYHLGLFAAKFQIAGNARLKRLSGLVFSVYVFLVAVSMAEAISLHTLENRLDSSQLKASSLLASLALFVFALAGPHKVLDRLLDRPWLCFLGRESYLIYLSHLLVLPKTALFLSSVRFFLHHQFLVVPLVVTATLAMTSLLALLCRFLLPSRGELLGVSGFRRADRAEPTCAAQNGAGVFAKWKMVLRARRKRDASDLSVTRARDAETNERKTVSR